MTNFLTKIFMILSFINCSDKEKPKTDSKESIIIESLEKSKEKEKTNNEEGYLFIEISKIYNNGGELSILKDDGTTLFLFKDKNVSIAGNTYEIVNDENIYKKHINIEAYFPENGLFIIEATKTGNGIYEMNIDNQKCKIILEKHKDILKFKTPQEYVLEGYPNPTKNNPLRINPEESSELVPNYKNYTYISVEIQGDWLKVADDKDCYSGEEPSKENIIGWIRWRKDGKMILDVRHIC